MTTMCGWVALPSGERGQRRHLVDSLQGITGATFGNVRLDVTIDERTVPQVDLVDRERSIPPTWIRASGSSCLTDEPLDRLRPMVASPGPRKRLVNRRCLVLDAHPAQDINEPQHHFRSSSA